MKKVGTIVSILLITIMVLLLSALAFWKRASGEQKKEVVKEIVQHTARSKEDHC